jgi:SAM-dependent methyltransferase
MSKHESQLPWARAISGTYDALAPRWDDWATRVVPDVREEWARNVERFVKPGERVVELGCGTGRPVGRLLAAEYDYVGVDVSTGMLQAARAADPTMRLVRADLQHARFAARSLGAVVAFFSISHTPREGHPDLFARIASWLRPGGLFVGNLASRDLPEDREQDWLGAGPMRWSGYDESRYVVMLARAGFELVERETVELTEPDGSTICPLWFVARLDPKTA